MRLIDADRLKRQVEGRSWRAKGKMIELIDDQPTADPGLDEWCTDCKEYDHGKHCCPRFNRVIRETLEEVMHTEEGEEA